ncbi:MAG: hypothetical protein ACRCYO_19340 [Bacteroidia bacterium]
MLLRICIFLFCFFNLSVAAQTGTPPTERLVSIDCMNRLATEVLIDLSRQANFYWSYDSRLVDPKKLVTLHEKNITVRRAIALIFDGKISCRSKGNHCILSATPEPLADDVASPPRKLTYTVGGYVTDVETGNRIPYTTVYDSISLHSALSDEWGYYQLELNASRTPVKLKASRLNYFDTSFVVVPSSNKTMDIQLRVIPARTITSNGIRPLPSDTGFAFQRIDSAQVVDYKKSRRGLDRFPWVDSIAGFEQAMRARNLKESLQQGGQVSFLPFVSTNGRFCGSVVNKFSLNIVAGYAGGVDGFELGGGVNIVRGDVRGGQLAGGVNLVGGDVRGAQVAGLLNLNVGTLRGVQLSGGANINMDSLRGIQVAGGSNFNFGSMYGIQVAGGSNFVKQDMDGLQVSATANVTFGTVNKVQVAGWGNYAQAVRGVQAAGTMNVAREMMYGVQVSGFLNRAGHVRGFQVSGFINSCRDTVTGTQIAAFLNHAGRLSGYQFGIVNVSRELNGLQIGIINVTRQKNDGLQIGLFSFARNGLHQLELACTEKLFTTISFRTGSPAFYNIFSAGQGKFIGEDGVWTIGYGMGHRFNLPRHLAVDLELVTNKVNLEALEFYTNNWTYLYAGMSWVPLEALSISIGPTFNYFVSGSDENYFAAWHPKPLIEKTFDTGTRGMGWVGLRCAIRFF